MRRKRWPPSENEGLVGLFTGATLIVEPAGGSGTCTSLLTICHLKYLLVPTSSLNCLANLSLYLEASVSQDFIECPSACAHLIVVLEGHYYKLEPLQLEIIQHILDYFCWRLLCGELSSLPSWEWPPPQAREEERLLWRSCLFACRKRSKVISIKFEALKNNFQVQTLFQQGFHLCLFKITRDFRTSLLFLSDPLKQGHLKLLPGFLWDMDFPFPFSFSKVSLSRLG